MPQTSGHILCKHTRANGRTVHASFEDLTIDPQRRFIATNALPQPHKEQKKKVFETFPSRLDGIHTQRVEAFIHSLGIPLGDYLLIDADDNTDLITSMTNSPSPLFKNQEEAINMTYWGLSLVQRNRAKEDLNSAVFTECLLVHELCHNSNQLAPRVLERIGPDNWNVGSPRVGFALTKGNVATGNFIEEGFCDYARGLYRNYTDFQNHVERITTHSSNPIIVNGSLIRFCPSRDFSGGGLQFLELPLKYFHVELNGSLTFSISAYAGYGMELLCSREPRLLATCCAARKDVDALRAVPLLINAIRPGLYSELRSLQYTEADLLRGLRLIMDSV
jgi:hypothetical protein